MSTKGLLSALVVVLAAAVPANAQVIHRVHVGGPDICDAVGQKPGCDANFSLVALEFANGKVAGQYTDRFGDLTGSGGFHARIDCISVAGNDAWVSGVITKGKLGGVDLAGQPVITRVRDNGTSNNDPPDQISFSFIGNSTSCLSQPNLPLFAVPQGQVVVE